MTNQKTLLIAEVGQSHDGSINLAHSYIDTAAAIGVDAIKFQTHYAAEESTTDDEFRVRFSYKDKNRFEYWKRMEFEKSEWKELFSHALEVGLDFMSSPFSLKAIQVLQEIGVKNWKISSGEIMNRPFLEQFLNVPGNVYVSTGMSTWQEIDNVVELFSVREDPIVLMQCTTAYPTPLDKVGINVLDEMRSRYPSASIGISDHSGTIYPALLSMAKQVAAVECHIAFSRHMFGPDTSSSLIPEEFAMLVRARDAFHAIESSKIDKNVTADNLRRERGLFSRSVAIVRPVPAGSRLSPSDLGLRKPGTGIPPGLLHQCVGRIAAKDLLPHTLLKEDDLREKQNEET